jgi:hypothetical protein
MKIKILQPKQVLLLLYFAVLSLISGCEKEVVYDVLEGDLIGSVKLYNSWRAVLDDHNGVTVTLEGSDPRVAVNTNAEGDFRFEGIRSGTYNLVFSKSGYTTHKEFGFQFVGGNVPTYAGRTSLYQLTSVRAEELTLSATANYFYVSMSGSCQASNLPAGNYSYFRYYLSDSPDVSWKNYRHTGVVFSGGTNIFLYNINDFIKYYPSGTDLYAIVYPCVMDSQYYVDMDTGNLIYTTVNSDNGSNVAHIVIPELLVLKNL